MSAGQVATHAAFDKKVLSPQVIEPVLSHVRVLAEQSKHTCATMWSQYVAQIWSRVDSLPVGAYERCGQVATQAPAERNLVPLKG